jgi:hypothetical protein
VAAALLPAGTLAASTLTDLAANREAQADAVRSLPLDELTPQVRARIQDVVARPTLFRRMPVKVIECDAELYRFLVRYPEVVVNIWQLMDITRVSLRRTGPYTLDAADGAGTVTTMELVYGTDDTHLIYCEGSYEGPLFLRPVQGRCVLLLKSAYTAESGRRQIVNRLDIFLQLDHTGAKVLTKTLHPLVGRSTDVNFLESTEFLERISRTAEANGPGVQRLASRLNNVHPAVRQRFAELTAAVSARSAAGPISGGSGAQASVAALAAGETGPGAPSPSVHAAAASAGQPVIVGSLTPATDR